MEPKFEPTHSPRADSRPSEDAEDSLRFPDKHSLVERGHVFQFLPQPEPKTHPSNPRPVQDMDDYSNPPPELPIIIREKDLLNRQKTMKHFLSINDFNDTAEEIKKKESHHKIHKHAPLEYITNISTVTSSHFDRKKNQGLMLVNELWGQKYHQSIMEATGLRKANYQIKGKALKAASERVTAVRKYYEDKHKDEIQREREFLELLVIPVENTESNPELKAKLDSDDKIKRSSGRTMTFATHRKIHIPTNSGSVEASPKKISPGSTSNRPQQSTEIFYFPRKHSAPMLEMSNGLKTDSSRQNSVDSGYFSDRKIPGGSDTEESPFAGRQSNAGNGFQPLNPSKFRGESEDPSNGQKLEKVSEELEGDSSLVKKGRKKTNSASTSKKDISIQEISTTESPVPSGMKSMKHLSSPQGEKSKFPPTKPQLRAQLFQKLEPIIRPESGSAKNSLTSTPKSSTLHRKTFDSSREDYGSKFRISSPQPSFYQKGSKAPSTMSNSNLSGFQDRRYSNPSYPSEGLPPVEPQNGSGAVRTDEIERLKKNFLNLVVYCEEVREDYQVKETMKETKKTTQNLFATREKTLKDMQTKQSQEQLERSIKKRFAPPKNKLKG